MESDCIKYSEISFLPKLISDYLYDNSSLNEHYSFEPTLTGFKEAIDSRSFSQESRNTLVEVLKGQYKKMDNCELQFRQIELLQQESTFTITTGHQLCLFTGPLYFIYKILSVVKLTERLKKEFPTKNFVPVYWMASEDHDFEEINHFFLHNNRFNCSTSSLGAVGTISPDFGDLLALLKKELGKGKLAEELFSIFKEAYSNSTLSEATFKLVHALLGDYGIVIIEPDNEKLKEEFKPFVIKELSNQTSFEEVTKSSKKLNELNYKTQVNSRDVNLFYLGQDTRIRIEKTDEGFKLSDDSKKWSFESILEEVDKFPERFSPNVILRPLYQEIVLPNLSYTGGAGELSYWFQLKGMFGKFGVDFPILMLRNSALVLSTKNGRRLEKLDLKMSDLFLEISDLESLLLKKHNENEIDLEQNRQDLLKIMEEIKKLAVKVSPALSVTVDATSAKSLKLLSKLEKKLIRHEKINIKIVFDQLYLILEELFPNGTFQERRTNFSEYYLEKGKEFFAEAYTRFDPFEMDITVLKA